MGSKRKSTSDTTWNSKEYWDVNNWLWEGLDPDDELLIAYNRRPSEDMTSMCALCYKWFRSSDEFHAHMMTHIGTARFHECSICHKRFLARFLRIRHESTHKYESDHPYTAYWGGKNCEFPGDKLVPNHPMKRFKPVPYSPQHIKDLKKLEKKIRTEPITCIACKQEFKEHEDLQTHYEITHAVQTCVHCFELIENFSLYMAHLKNKHGIETPTNCRGGRWMILDSMEKKRQEMMLSRLPEINKIVKKKIGAAETISRSQNIPTVPSATQTDGVFPEQQNDQSDAFGSKQAGCGEAHGSALETGGKSEEASASTYNSSEDHGTNKEVKLDAPNNNMVGHGNISIPAMLKALTANADASTETADLLQGLHPSVEVTSVSETSNADAETPDMDTPIQVTCTPANAKTVNYENQSDYLHAPIEVEVTCAAEKAESDTELRTFMDSNGGPDENNHGSPGSTKAMESVQDVESLDVPIDGSYEQYDSNAITEADLLEDIPDTWASRISPDIIDGVSMQKVYPCNVCGRQFTDERQRNKHSKLHNTGDKPFECKYCKKPFATHSNRKEHERIHTGERPYKCPSCDKRFIQISNLKKHLQTHKDRNIYKCSACQKEFAKESSLVLHQRSHATERRFRCEVCDRAYNYASLLKRHMRTHTGERPYQCPECQLPFHELVSLHYHRKKMHTGERPHKCDACGRGFILSSDLKKHMKVHSKSGPDSQSDALGETNGADHNMGEEASPKSPDEENPEHMEIDEDELLTHLNPEITLIVQPDNRNGDGVVDDDDDNRSVHYEIQNLNSNDDSTDDIDCATYEAIEVNVDGTEELQIVSVKDINALEQESYPSESDRLFEDAVSYLEEEVQMKQ